MKLQQIITGSSHLQFRFLAGNVPGRLGNDIPLAYVFVESVIGGKLLTETNSDRLTSLLKAGIAKLQNFLTPDATSDLDALLFFIAPKSGGLPKIKELIKAAKDSPDDILKDEEWWRDMFDTFGLSDPAIQQEVRVKVEEEVGATAATPPPEADQPGWRQRFTDFMGQMGEPPGGDSAEPDPSFMHDLHAERQATAQDQNDLYDMLRRNTVSRKEAVRRFKELQARIEALKAARKARRGVAEATADAITTGIAQNLLAETDIRSNLRFIASNMMRRLGYPSVVPYQESDWLKKFVQTVGGYNHKEKDAVEEGLADFTREMRHFFANPNYSTGRLDDSARRDRNQRAAKLAAQILFNKLRTEMEQRLKVANLTLQDVHETIKRYKDLEARHKRGSRDPRLMAAIREVVDKIKRILYAVHPDMARAATMESLQRLIPKGFLRN
jgi:hypothetical protein